MGVMMYEVLVGQHAVRRRDAARGGDPLDDQRRTYRSPNVSRSSDRAAVRVGRSLFVERARAAARGCDAAAGAARVRCWPTTRVRAELAEPVAIGTERRRAGAAATRRTTRCRSPTPRSRSAALARLGDASRSARAHQRGAGVGSPRSRCLVLAAAGFLWALAQPARTDGRHSLAPDAGFARPAEAAPDRHATANPTSTRVDERARTPARRSARRADARDASERAPHAESRGASAQPAATAPA